MSLSYNYGEEVSYSFGMLRPEDYEKLQAFSCGNDALDRFIFPAVKIDVFAIGFKDFEGDMLKENNQEINANSPMYYEL